MVKICGQFRRCRLTTPAYIHYFNLVGSRGTADSTLVVFLVFHGRLASLLSSVKKTKTKKVRLDIVVLLWHWGGRLSKEWMELI